MSLIFFNELSSFMNRIFEDLVSNVARISHTRQKVEYVCTNCQQNSDGQENLTILSVQKVPIERN